MVRRRKKKSMLPAVIALLVVVLICAILLRFVFVLRNVDVSGNTGTASREDVIRAADVDFGASIFRVDPREVAERIDSTGILRAEDVHLSYPDALSISVQPRRRVAMALHLGQIRVLDEFGCLVESLSAVPAEDLVYISGLRVQSCAAGRVINADADQLQAYCDIMQALVSQSAAIYVSEVKLDNAQDISIITRTGITVELGDASNAQDKIAWMKGAVADLERRGQGGGTLDVRSGNKADYRPG